MKRFRVRYRLRFIAGMNTADNGKPLSLGFFVFVSSLTALIHIVSA